MSFDFLQVVFSQKSYSMFYPFPYDMYFGLHPSPPIYEFYELILLLKVYMPSKKTEAVLLLTTNEKADPDLGVNHTPHVGCFFNILKIQLSLLLYYLGHKKATAMVFI